MKYIIKRSVVLLGKNNIIKFGYDVKINKNKNGFENFDIRNEKYLIDDMLEKLNGETIEKLNKESPIYVSLSDYFFSNLANLCAIEYETSNDISRISRQDLSAS